jgi:hypothetical protein
VEQSSIPGEEESSVASDSDTFSVNDRINHVTYGLGTISEINHLYTTIEFDENGRRKFVTSMVRLEHTDEAPPPPPKKKRARSKTTKTTKTKARK